MKKVQKKWKDNKGFTLAELLIVVAIIAILVAVSIPIFTSKLEKTREATDIANMRAAKSAATTSYLTDSDGLGSSQTDTVTLYYNADAGTLETSDADITGYGKGTATSGGSSYSGYSNTTAYTDQIINVVVTTDGTVTVNWAAKAS